MSKETILKIIDESLLKGLDQTYGESEETAQCHVWASVQNYNDTRIGTFKITRPSIPDSQYFDVLKQPWSEIPIIGGVRTKAIPTTFSDELCRLIEENWESLPMDSRDILLEKGKLYQDQKLTKTIERILGIEIVNPLEDLRGY